MPIHEGSSILLSTSALGAIRQSTSATAMARMLLVAVFDHATLLVSNLKGGASKRPGTDDTRLHRLDAAKLEAIYGEFCMYVKAHLQRGSLCNCDRE